VGCSWPTGTCQQRSCEGSSRWRTEQPPIKDQPQGREHIHLNSKGLGLACGVHYSHILRETPPCLGLRPLSGQLSAVAGLPAPSSDPLIRHVEAFAWLARIHSTGDFCIGERPGHPHRTGVCDPTSGLVSDGGPYFNDLALAALQTSWLNSTWLYRRIQQCAEFLGSEPYENLRPTCSFAGNDTANGSFSRTGSAGPIRDLLL